ncbi:hypothetical protein ACEQ8H_008515 [Pleosporales sp. CAS-2024a]
MTSPTMLVANQLLNVQPGSHAGPLTFRTCFSNMQQLAQKNSTSAVTQVVYMVYLWVVTCDYPLEYIAHMQANRSSRVKRFILVSIWEASREM